jgi:hypothetical protein
MRITGKMVLFLLVLCLPAFAQERGQSGSGAGTGERGAPAATPASSAAAAPSTARVSSSESSSSMGVQSREAYLGMGSSTPVFARGIAPQTPNLENTSFTSANTYYGWHSFYFQLMNRYRLDPEYARRLYINREPLLTPGIVRLAMFRPMALSSRILAELDSLEQMIQDHQAGNSLNKQEIALKMRNIRNLTKQINSETNWSFVDQRKDQDILKGIQTKQLGLDGIARMHEIAVDLHNQLRNWYQASSTNTISASSLQSPSIESLTRGIQKISQAVESSMR